MTAIASRATSTVGQAFLGSNDLAAYSRSAATWHERAACRGLDTGTFYARDGQRARSLREHEQRAKAICAGCPVIAECLAYALDANEPWGVWGGQTVDERHAIALRSTG
jgi:WhiB family redox-sensing transcriptional regulator